MSAVACFSDTNVQGEVLFFDTINGCRIEANFSKLPPGEHGFHIHKAGDMRGKGCLGACDHYHKGSPTQHGGPPTMPGPRHTGDLGNISGSPCKKTYMLKHVKTSELFGRSIIVHEDPDDLGKGPFEDSLITGHAGKRLSCSIIGRIEAPSCLKKTRKNKHKH